MNAEDITTEISEVLRAELHDLYRQLHRAPELSMQEYGTADLIRERMEGLGYAVFSCGGTGVVAVLRNGAGPIVAFRADIDGLPIAEDTGLEYASTAHGTLQDGTDVAVMHACGHDSHIVCAIGAATLLARSQNSWSGTIEFIFQPGEETGEGAIAMIEDGLWQRAPIPEVIFAQHLSASPAGMIEISSGSALAMADNWRVTVHGMGGHGSQPDATIDPVVLTAYMIVRIQSVVSREVNPQQSAVVTIATIRAGVKNNVIPSSAEFTLNIRSIGPKTRTRVLAAVRRIILAEAQASGAPEPTIEELPGFPGLYNDPELTVQTILALSTVLGAECVVQRPPLMGSEDFGHLGGAIDVPCCYWFFGGMADVEGNATPPSNHSPHFAPVLEPTLTVGVRAAVTAILSRLRPSPSAGERDDGH